MKKQLPIRIENELYEEVKKKLKEIDRSFNSYVIQLITSRIMKVHRLI